MQLFFWQVLLSISESSFSSFFDFAYALSEMPTGITQNVKDLLSSREVQNIFENSDFVYMLNQAQGDREILAKQLNISQQQMTYVTHSDAGEGLIFYGNVILPFIDRFPQDTELYRVMTTKPGEVSA